jgi:hypothetical protein
VRRNSLSFISVCLIRPFSVSQRCPLSDPEPACNLEENVRTIQTLLYEPDQSASIYSRGTRTPGIGCLLEDLSKATSGDLLIKLLHHKMPRLYHHNAHYKVVNYVDAKELPRLVAESVFAGVSITAVLSFCSTHLITSHRAIWTDVGSRCSGSLCVCYSLPYISHGLFCINTRMFHDGMLLLTSEIGCSSRQNSPCLPSRSPNARKTGVVAP